MGLIFTTSGWTGAEVSFDAGGDGAGTFSTTGDQNNAYDVAVALKAWIEDAARPWAGVLTGASFEVVTVDDQARVTFEFRAGLPTFVPTGNTAWNARFRLYVVGEDPIGVTRGSVSAVPGTVMWDRRDTERGTRTRAGSFRMGHGLYSHRSPSVEVPMDLAQAYAFNEAIQIAAVPRTAYLYDEQADLWRFVTVGRHTLAPHTDTDVTKVVATIDVLGGL